MTGPQNNRAVPVPAVDALRARVGNVTAWARRNGFSPAYTLTVLRRHGGGSVDLGRLWGPASRNILLAAARAVNGPEAQEETPARGEEPSRSLKEEIHNDRPS